MKISNLAGKEAKLTKSKTKKIFFSCIFTISDSVLKSNA